jgi:hypothetical protein
MAERGDCDLSRPQNCPAWHRRGYELTGLVSSLTRHAFQTASTRARMDGNSSRIDEKMLDGATLSDSDIACMVIMQAIW